MTAGEQFVVLTDTDARKGVTTYTYTYTYTDWGDVATDERPVLTRKYMTQKFKVAIYRLKQTLMRL